MATDPKKRRFAPGSDPVPEGEQIQEWPADSADWMNREPQGYSEPLFPESDGEPEPEPDERKHERGE